MGVNLKPQKAQTPGPGTTLPCPACVDGVTRDAGETSEDVCECTGQPLPTVHSQTEKADVPPGHGELQVGKCRGPRRERPQ